MAFCKYIPAKSISYGSKRDYDDVKYIVIHYTGNNGDTATGNANYFKSTNTRSAGAHFFVDRNGVIVKSIKMNLTAWSVGGAKYSGTEGGSYYGKCKNANSVSIELCDIASKEPSDKQIAAIKKLVKHIREYCPNAKNIIRHWDVTGKSCPATMTGKSNKKWTALKKAIQ